MCVCYRSQLIRKRSKAVEISWRKHKHKKNNNNLLPGQIIYQRSGISSVYSLRHRQIETTDYTVFSSKPKVGGDIRASHITAHSSLRRSKDVTTDIDIFNILNSYFSFICLVFYLSYIFILYIYLFIIYLFLLFSAIRRPFPHFTDSLHEVVVWIDKISKTLKSLYPFFYSPFSRPSVRSFVIPSPL